MSIPTTMRMHVNDPPPSPHTRVRVCSAHTHTHTHTHTRTHNTHTTCARTHTAFSSLARHQAPQMSRSNRLKKGKRKAKPAANVGWLVGDVLMARWYHESSLNSPYRGSYYVAEVLEVNTSTTGRKIYSVRYNDDSSIEKDVRHGNTRALENNKK